MGAGYVGSHVPDDGCRVQGSLVMALGEVAKCHRCGVFASGDELFIDKSTPMYDYVCRDAVACEVRRTDPDAIKERERRRKKRGSPNLSGARA